MVQLSNHTICQHGSVLIGTGGREGGGGMDLLTDVNELERVDGDSGQMGSIGDVAANKESHRGVSYYWCGWHRSAISR